MCQHSRGVNPDQDHAQNQACSRCPINAEHLLKEDVFRVPELSPCCTIQCSQLYQGCFLALSNYNKPYIVGFLGWEDPLEKVMATHSSSLAWINPWTEEPSGLQSMGLQKSWTRRRDLAHTYTYLSNLYSCGHTAVSSSVVTSSLPHSHEDTCDSI